MSAVDEVDRLRSAAAAAADRAAKAQAAAERAAGEEAGRREVRLREWDEKVVAEFDGAALAAGVQAALDAVGTAVINSGDVYGAWMTYQVQHRTWWQLVLEANSAASRLGSPPLAQLPTSVREDLAPVVREAVAREAGRQAEDQTQARDQAREDYASG